MLKIKLQRRGRKGYATYRIVVAEASSGPRGKSVADLGHFDPNTGKIGIDSEKVTYWISVGAKPTKTAHFVLFKAGAIKDKPPKKTVKSKKVDKVTK